MNKNLKEISLSILIISTTIDLTHAQTCLLERECFFLPKEHFETHFHFGTARI